MTHLPPPRAPTSQVTATAAKYSLLDLTHFHPSLVARSAIAYVATVDTVNSALTSYFLPYFCRKPVV